MSLEHDEDALGSMKAFNIQEMASELGVGEEEYRTLLRLFAKNATREAAGIRGALQAKDWDEVARLAHSLKGAAVSLGLEELHLTAHALENGARSGSPGELASLAEAMELRLADFERLLGDEPAHC